MNEELQAGQEYKLEFKSSNFVDIAGYQFTLEVDPERAQILEVAGANLGVDGSNFGFKDLDRGIITTSWNSHEGLTKESDEILFTMILQAKQAIRLDELITINDRRTKAEAYSSAELVHDVNLQFVQENGGEPVFELYQNLPNPFLDETRVGFTLPSDMEATITIYDVAGKSVRTVTGSYTKGYNRIDFKRQELGSAGVLYYQLDTEDFTATRKMILME